ncbi:MAG: SlyX family protein [Desulfovibrionaceae bacterium]|nr:SlyX family protein [Desulfovibrionaceae bacterium]
MSSALEERVTRLEEDNYFLRRRLEELNSAMVFQQKQIDALESCLARVSQLVRQLRDAQSSQASADLPANDPPPHYNSW